MVGFRPADDAAYGQWLDEYEGRLTAWLEPRGAGSGVQRRLSGWANAPDRALLMITGPAGIVGHLAVAHHPDGGFAGTPLTAAVHDLWVEPEHRGQGFGRAARSYAEAWGVERGASVIAASLWGDDAGLAALYADYVLRHQRMFKRLEPGQAAPAAGVSFRPMREAAEYEAWVEREAAAYAEQVADSGSNDRSVTTETYDDILPQGPKTPGHALFVIESGQQPVADLWLGPFAPGVGFVMSVEVRPAFRGRGFARSAMAIAEEQALAAGNTFLGLNVFGHNDIAIGLYHRIGYEVVQSHRSLDFPSV